MSGGDTEFTMVVDRYYGSLYRFALSLTRREADACDLVQETFYIWMKKRDRIREASRTKSWLFTTLHREFLQHCRRTARHPEVELTDAQDDLPMEAPSDWGRLDGQQIAEGIHHLDTTFRAPMALFYLEDFSYEEIGSALGIPLGTVKSRLSRGIAQLRIGLAKDIRAGKGAGNDQS